MVMLSDSLPFVTKLNISLFSKIFFLARGEFPKGSRAKGY
jgi:hypothetical protein